MNRRKNQVILVEKKRSRLVACSVGRVECEFGEEALTRGVAASDLLELDEVVTASHGVFINALEMWFVPEAGTLQFGRPARTAGSKRAHGLNEGKPIGDGARRWRGCHQRLNWIGCVRHEIQGTLRRTRADTGEE